jgi:hypothetical protein
MAKFSISAAARPAKETRIQLKADWLRRSV